MIERLRNDHQAVLLLDCGGILPDKPEEKKNQDIYADIILRSFDIMSYDAMALAPSDFDLGLADLEKYSDMLSFPFVATNLKVRDHSLPWLRSHLVKRIGAFQIAVLSLMPEGKLAKSPNMEFIPPETALKNELSKLKQNADIDLVILFSRLDERTTVALKEKVEGVDLVVLCDWLNPKGDPEAMVGCGSDRGKFLKYARLYIPEGGRVSLIEKEAITLDESVPHTRKIDELIHKGHEKEIARYKREKARKFREQQEELLKLTPREFFEKMRTEQQRTGKDG